MLVRAKVTHGNTMEDYVYLDARFLMKTQPEAIDNERIYPNGFYGPILLTNNQTTPPIAANINIAGATVSSGVSEQGIRPTPHPFIMEMMDKHLANPLFMENVNNQMELVKFVKETMGHFNLRPWLTKQVYSPVYTETHHRFMEYIFSNYPRRGKLETSFKIWHELLNIDFNANNQNAFRDKERRIDEVIGGYNHNLGVCDWIAKVTSHTGGWLTLLYIMHTIYGE